MSRDNWSGVKSGPPGPIFACRPGEKWSGHTKACTRLRKAKFIIGPTLVSQNSGALLAERKLDRSTFGAKTGPGPLLAELKLDGVHFWYWTECVFHSDGSQQTNNCLYIVLQAFQGRERMTSSTTFLLEIRRISNGNAIACGHESRW